MTHCVLGPGDNDLLSARPADNESLCALLCSEPHDSNLMLAGTGYIVSPCVPVTGDHDSYVLGAW
jgi:hypothetical protein